MSHSVIVHFLSNLRRYTARNQSSTRCRITEIGSRSTFSPVPFSNEPTIGDSPRACALPVPQTLNATEQPIKHDRVVVAGEEVVTVPPTSGGQDSWKVQTLSLSTESPSNRRRGCRPQLQPGKRTRPAPPPPSISCKVNAKDINKYFDWPNKENTPRNAVNASQGTNEPQPEDEQSIMGSNLSRHNGKGLTGRRTQSSGNLCEPKGKLNTMGKILVPCSSAQKER